VRLEGTRRREPCRVGDDAGAARVRFVSGSGEVDVGGEGVVDVDVDVDVKVVLLVGGAGLEEGR